jgi:hypothetical protein
MTPSRRCLPRRRGLGLASAALAGLCLAGPAAAQVPPDTVPRDTLRRVVPDTLDPGALAQDTTAPARPLVRFPILPPAAVGGSGSGVWVWDHAALLREAPTSLVDLLERIPGITTFRAGMFVQPEAASFLGAAGERVEIEIDGFVMDPMAAATLDVAQIPLGHLREVRVERRLGLLRIRLVTESPDEQQPFTRVEAGIGVPPANLFRGTFLVPHVLAGPLGIGVESLGTDGTGRTEPANVFSGWVKWAYTTDNRGVQLELWRSTLRREGQSPWPVERVRQDLVLRARNVFAPGLIGEIYGGRAILDETAPVATGEGTADVRTERDNLQAGARLLYRPLEGAALTGSMRYRSAEFLPSVEAVLEGETRLGPARVGGEVAHASWREQGGATRYGLHAELRPVPFAGVFGELTGGRRGAPSPADPAAALMVERSGWRAGITAAIGTRASGSIAVLDVTQDLSLPFGLPFDSAAQPLLPQPARGIEAHGRVVLWPGWFALESAITEWTRLPGWAWTPARSWRTALELHAVPLESGNLEVLGRLEGAHRSGVVAFLPGVTEDGAATVAMPGYTQLNGYIHIRIIDVRAFVGWDDILGQLIEEVPGRVHRGPRIFYGVKWNLRN